MTLRSSLAVPWTEFVADWCLGAEPLFSESEVREGFETLERLFPEALDRFEVQGKGLYFVHAAVDLGQVLAATESLRRFAPVLARFKGGQVSALAELIFAAGLVRSGVVPELEPEQKGKRPDLGGEFNGEKWFAEVVKPGQGDALEEARAQQQRLAGELLPRISGVSAEVLLDSTADLSAPEVIADSIAAVTARGVVEDLPGIGNVRMIEPPAAVISPSIPHTGPGPIAGFAQARIDEGVVSATVALRLPIGDDRAQRILQAELHHFDRDDCNLVFMDVTNVIGGIREWRPLIQRRFQPSQNRRIGAVVLYEHTGVGPKVQPWKRWHVMRNPYAYKPPPSGLLDAIQALDAGPLPGASAE